MLMNLFLRQEAATDTMLPGAAIIPQDYIPVDIVYKTASD
jgi:hypothetical protein